RVGTAGRGNPQHEVGEGEVGEQLPIRDEQMDVFDVRFIREPLGRQQFVEHYSFLPAEISRPEIPSGLLICRFQTLPLILRRPDQPGGPSQAHALCSLSQAEDRTIDRRDRSSTDRGAWVTVSRPRIVSVISITRPTTVSLRSSHSANRCLAREPGVPETREAVASRTAASPERVAEKKASRIDPLASADHRSLRSRPPMRVSTCEPEKRSLTA